MLQRYLLLAYGLNWLLLAPWLYAFNAFQGQRPWWVWALVPLAYIGGSSPSVAAIILAARSPEAGALRRLATPMLWWRVPIRWYAVALLVPPLATAVSLVIADRGLSTLGDFALLPFLTALPATYVLALPFGPLGEELGWRGTALTELMTRVPAWQASLIVGVFWTFWHVPQMLMLPGASIPSIMPVTATSVLLYLIQISGICALITLVFVGSGGSLLLAILTHLAFNTAENVVYAGLPTMSPQHTRAVYLVNVWVLAAVGAVSLIALSRRRPVVAPLLHGAR